MENMGWGGGPEVMQYPIDRERLTFNFGAKIVASKLAPLQVIRNFEILQG